MVRKRKRERAETSTVGRRGNVVIPARLRKLFGLDEGSILIAEEREDGILFRPAAVVPVPSGIDPEVVEDRYWVELVTRRRADPANRKVPWSKAEKRP